MVYLDIHFVQNSQKLITPSSNIIRNTRNIQVLFGRPVHIRHIIKVHIEIIWGFSNLNDPLPPPLHPGPGPALQHGRVSVQGEPVPDILLGVVRLSFVTPEMMLRFVLILL